MRTLDAPALPDAAERAARVRAPLVTELRRAAAPARAPRRRLRPALVAAAVLVAALATALPRDAATPALAVERDDGWLVLRVADVAAGEEALTRELRDAGIRGEVRLLPVPDHSVGKWAAISELAGRRAPESETVRLGSIRIERETVRIPVAEVRESTGYFVFYAGRRPRDGEQLWRDGERWLKPPGMRR